MGETSTSRSIIISDDISSLPSGEDILRSFRRRATLTTAKLTLGAGAVLMVSRAIKYVESGELYLALSVGTWVIAGGLLFAGRALAERDDLDRATTAVLGGIIVVVVLLSFVESAALALISFCLGYPVLYLCAVGLSRPEHLRAWTRAMPVVLAVNVLGRQLLNPIELLRDPIDLLTVAVGGALGMVLVGRIAEGLLRALRRALALSESVRRGLERSQRQIVAHRDALEERVRDRTRDLEEKNRVLGEALASLQRTQEQLVQSEKMASLGLLVAGIAHEIKNPLNFVNNFAEMAIEFIDEHRARAVAGPLPPAEVEATFDDVDANLRRIREHGQRADGIINAMLMHSRERRGEATEFDLNALVLENATLAYQGFRAGDRAFRADLEIELDERVGLVQAPYQEIARVVVNLVSNACHAARERVRSGEEGYRPVLRISTERAGDEVELRIRDNGVGIPAEVRRRLFDPFFTTKPPGEGTGLGLSMSYEVVVKELGGAIRVDSTPGEGAEFTVRLPLGRVPGRPSGARQQPVTSPQVMEG